MTKVENKTATKSMAENAMVILTAGDTDLSVRDTSSVAHFSQYVRALMQNWRQGTVGVKGRSDVSFSGKKPWKQKGTGRARAGAASSPLWRSGGVTFGPMPRTRQLVVPKKIRQLVLNQLFAQLVSDNKVRSLDWNFEGDVPKTKLATAVLKQHELTDAKVLLFVSNADVLTQRSFANIPNVRIVLFDQANAYDLAVADCVLVLKKDMAALKEMVAQWN